VPLITAMPRIQICLTIEFKRTRGSGFVWGEKGLVVVDKVASIKAQPRAAQLGRVRGHGALLHRGASPMARFSLKPKARRRAKVSPRGGG
jgi:hypothetical protein